MRRIALTCTLLTLCAATRAQEPALPPAPPAAQARLAEGHKFEQRQQLSDALSSYKDALKAGGKDCLACYDAMARLSMKMEAFGNAADAAMQIAQHTPDSALKAASEYRAGLALMRQYHTQMTGGGAIAKDEKHAPDALRRAEPILRQATVDAPGDERIRMLHGRVLAALRQDSDATAEFTACASQQGISAQECQRAQRFAKDTSLARTEPSPAFELTTAEGRKVSLDSLAGKVVLIDFWATWCSVCARDSDYVQSMAEAFDDGRFVLLEVSGDEDETAWRNFLDSHRLLGVQTHDSKSTVGDLFHVAGYPTYIILDGDGSIRLRAVGIEGDLKGTVRKLLAAMPPATAKSESSGN